MRNEQGKRRNPFDKLEFGGEPPQAHVKLLGAGEQLTFYLSLLNRKQGNLAFSAKNLVLGSF